MRIYFKNILLIITLTSILTCSPKISETFEVKNNYLEENFSISFDKLNTPLTYDEKIKLIENLKILNVKIINDYKKIEEFKEFFSITPAITLNEKYSFMRENETINKNYDKNRDINIILVRDQYSEINKIIFLLSQNNNERSIINEKIVDLQSTIKSYHENYMDLFSIIEKKLKNISCEAKNTNCTKTKILEGIYNDSETISGVNELKNNIERTQVFAENILN